MKKVLFLFASCCMAMGAMAQQWAGSSTTSDTIYRYGMVQIRPTSNALPYVQIKNNEISVRKSYGTDYPENYTKITPTSISVSSGIPVPASQISYSNIDQGTFNFHSVSGQTEHYFQLNSSGLLTTNGDIEVLGTISANTVSASNKVTAPNIAINSTSVPTNFKFGVTGKSYFSDFVGIGTTNLTATSGYKLAVDGGILCEEVKVISNVPSSDYVFEKDYNLRSLGEVEAYVNENKHLPDVPSAKEFKENGYKMGDMDNLLLQKVEELTLYIIDLQKQIEELKQEK
ncbi:MAG: hypothetical protein IK117_02225 [Bacteroidales bacterium]|nr:hypothetical protein [Bacteroidales bacterium]